MTTSHPLPDAVLAQHTAILGKTGSGKSSSGKLIVEQVVDEGFRVCTLDPIKSDWWGLTSSADGKSPGLPFKILGGPRGHVPLHSSAGAAIGALVGSGKLPHSIIDMADFEPGGLQRFFVDFAPALLRSARGVIYLVIEEAHEFAPKERAGFGAENLAIHWAKKLATAGRSKGIRLVVATQRVQSLHNAVLGSCETIIAHRLTTPADQKPVVDWLKANSDRETLERVSGSLSSLPTGTAWVCSGEAGIFEKIGFPKFRTFDNNATPERDGAEIEVTTAPVNHDELRAIIGHAVEEAEANDPKALKARIAELEKAMSGNSTSKEVAKHDTPDPQALADAEQRGYVQGYEAGAKAVASDWRMWAREIGFVMERAERRLATPWAYRDEQFGEYMPDPKSGSPAARETAATAPRERAAPAAAPKPPVVERAAGALTPALQRALDAIAWWHKIGQAPIERARAAVVAGLSPKASTFGVYVADLSKRGLVLAADGKVSLTDAGMAIANMPAGATRKDLHAMAAALLTPAEARAFEIVYRAAPHEIERRRVAEELGLSPKASTTNVYLSAVAGYGLIENAGAGKVRAADWLFPERRR